jgi:hypothetical protein
MSSRKSVKFAECLASCDTSSSQHPTKSILRKHISDRERNLILKKVETRQMRIAKLFSNVERNVSLEVLVSGGVLQNFSAAQLWIDQEKHTMCFRSFWSFFSHQEIDLDDVRSLTVGLSSLHCGDQQSSSRFGLWKSVDLVEWLCFTISLHSGICIQVQCQNSTQLQAWVVGISELVGCFGEVTEDEIRHEIEQLKLARFVNKSEQLLASQNKSIARQEYCTGQFESKWRDFELLNTAE